MPALPDAHSRGPAHDQAIKSKRYECARRKILAGTNLLFAGTGSFL